MRLSVVEAVDRFHFDRRNGSATPSRNSPKVICGLGAMACLAFTSAMTSACLACASLLLSLENSPSV